MNTAQTVYTSTVLALSKSERLKLAALILDELAQSAGAALDYSDSWSDEDVRDLAAYAGEYAAQSYPEEGARA